LKAEAKEEAKRARRTKKAKREREVGNGEWGMGFENDFLVPTPHSLLALFASSLFT
jgi:hypothetical protein